jgi:hypothetical protein
MVKETLHGSARRRISLRDERASRGEKIRDFGAFVVRVGITHPFLCCLGVREGREKNVPGAINPARIEVKLH